MKGVYNMAIGGLGYLNQINRTNSSAASSIQKIVTGSQRPSAKYGASSYAISSRMNSNVGTAAQSKSNAQTANAMLNVAAGGVSSTVNALSNIKSQILQAANGTNQDSDLAAVGQTIAKAVSTINDNASIEYNGMKLLDGSRSITVAGDMGYNTVDLGNLSSEALGLTDAAGNSKLDLTSAAGIASALDTVDSALESVSGMATDIGAAQQGLMFSESNYTTSGESLTAALSTEDDTDIAAEVAKLRSAETQNQIALHAQKMFMHNSAQVLSLLP